MMESQSITVNDTYTAQNLVNILTNNSTCSTTSTYSVSGDRPQKSYGSLIPERAVSLPRRNSFKHLSISKAVGPLT
jgi:hypothetical protein